MILMVSLATSKTQDPTTTTISTTTTQGKMFGQTGENRSQIYNISMYNDNVIKSPK